MNCAQAKTIPISTLLASMGMMPVRTDSRGMYYRSPWSASGDRHPSLQVSPDGHAFHDWSCGRHGSIIDMAMLLAGTTSVSDALTLIDRAVHIVIPPQTTRISSDAAAHKKKKEPGLVITGVYPLRSRTLLGYLWGRGIHREIAAEYCSEVYYYMKDRPDRRFYAVGWRNDSGGYELRNAIIKLAAAPKDITTVNDLSSCPFYVFEGFVDYLSAIQLGIVNPERSNAIVMNSTAMIRRAIDALAVSGPAEIICLLDSDDAGHMATELILEAFPRAIDCSSFYGQLKYKDVNEYLSFSARTRSMKNSLQ